MNSPVLENVNAGLLYLHNASTKKDFFSHLELLFAELFRNCRFSVLAPTELESVFRLEYSSGMGRFEFQRRFVRLEALKDIARSGKDFAWELQSAPRLFLPDGDDLPVLKARVIRSESAFLGLMVFHDELEFQESEQVFGLESYLFDHVFAAYQRVRERDLLLERLEESNAKVDAIGEISELLRHLDLDVLLSHIMAVSMRLTEAQVGSIVLDESLEADVEWGLPRTVLDRIRRRGGECLSEIVRQTREPILVCSYRGNREFEPVAEFHIESFLCAPLVSKGRVLGTVNLVNGDASRGGMFTEKDKAAIVTVASLAAIAIENAILHTESIEKERLKASLQIAQSIQRGMYPVKALKVPGYDSAWYTKSCDETGGDYFDFLELKPPQVGFSIGDVSGHGIGAALLMATGRANLRALLSVKTDLKEVMERLNDLLGKDMDADKFMTLFIGRLDHDSHHLSYVNAGHDPPLIYSRLDGTIKELEATGIPLGMMSGWSYELGSDEILRPGDVLVLTTDGIWEATSKERQPFGKEHLRSILKRSAEGTAQGIADAILDALDVHMGGFEFQDDITLFVLKRIAESKTQPGFA